MIQIGQITYEDAVKRYLKCGRQTLRNGRVLRFTANDGRVIKKRATTVWNYCEYVYALLRRHNIAEPYEGINLRDRKLLKEYRIDYNQGYSDMTAFFRDIGVITMTSSEFSNGYDKKCQEYSIDVSKFYSCYKTAWERQYLLYRGTFEDATECEDSLLLLLEKDNRYNTDISKYLLSLEKDFDSESLIDFLERKKEYTEQLVIPIDEIISDVFYTENREAFQLIDTVDIIKMEKITLPVPDDLYDRDLLASYYASRARNNPYYIECQKEIDFLNQYVDYPIQMHMRPNHEVSKDKSEIRIWASCRQYNDLCKSKSTVRKEALLNDGYDLDFDIHSTIYSLARFLNYGVFDIDWDIKRELFDNYDELKRHKDVEPYKTELRHIKKDVLSRIFFNKDIKSVWYGYRQMYIKETEGHFTYETIASLYNDAQKLMGGSKPYQTTIFLYESLLELRVMHEMIDRGYDVRNVYDCFYFKSSQTTVEEVKQIITDEVHTLLTLRYAV